MPGGETYLSAGVDLDTLDGIRQKIGASARLTHGPQVMGAAGAFAGAYRLEGYREPVLVSSTDGVGTKMRIGALLGIYESLGIDLVNLNIDDVFTRGAKPLFFLDYIGTESLDTQRIEALLRGMVSACRDAGCALIGGELAQMPSIQVGDSFELAGFVVGAVEREALIDGASISAGDILLGIPSSGVHTNGFRLVHRAFKTEEDPSVLYRRYDELSQTLGEELLTPHRCYFPLLEPALPDIKGMAHISGGGLPDNVPRVLPAGLAALLRPGSWDVHPIFDIVQREGKIDRDEMYRVFNMGLGMVIACSPGAVSEIQRLLPEAIVVGEVVPQTGEKRVVFEAA